MVHGNHHLVILPCLCSLCLYPFYLFVIIGFEIPAVAIVIQRQQADTLAKLGNIGKMFFIHSDCILKSEFIIQIEQIIPFCRFRCIAPFLCKGESLVIISFKIMVCCNGENPFSAGFQLFQKFYKAKMAFSFSVKG